MRLSLAWFYQRADAHPAVRPGWLFADDQDDSSAGWGDLRVIIGDLVRSHALSILVSLLPKYLDEVSWAPLAPCLSTGIAAEQLKKLYGFNHGISPPIPDQDPVGIDVVVIPYLPEGTVEQELEEQVGLFIDRHLGSQAG